MAVFGGCGTSLSDLRMDQRCELGSEDLAGESSAYVFLMRAGGEGGNCQE